MDNNSLGSAQTFRRLRFMCGYFLAVAIALASLFLLSSPLNIIFALFALAWGFNIFIIPYWSDKITFNSDGSLQWGVRKAAIMPNQVTKFKYSSVVTGFSKFFKFRSFVIYAKDSEIAPAVVINVDGWPTKDRIRLFQLLSDWLSKSNIEPDNETQVRLAKLAES